MPGASPDHSAGSEATLRGSLAYVTTLLASVGRCSGPERFHQEIALQIRHPRWHSSVVAERARGGAMSGSEHGSTLASSVVAGVREVISATVATVHCCNAGAWKTRIWFTT